MEGDSERGGGRERGREEGERGGGGGRGKRERIFQS